MNEVKIGDNKKNLVLKQTDDSSIIEVIMNKFDKQISLLFTREQLTIALKFIIKEEVENGE